MNKIEVHHTKPHLQNYPLTTAAWKHFHYPNIHDLHNKSKEDWTNSDRHQLKHEPKHVLNQHHLLNETGRSLISCVLKDYHQSNTKLPIHEYFHIWPNNFVLPNFQCWQAILHIIHTLLKHQPSYEWFQKTDIYAPPWN